MTKKEKCKNCIHWMPKQAELNYNSFIGICTYPKLEFNTTDGRPLAVLDRENPSGKHTNIHGFENLNDKSPHIGQPNKSRYCLVTDETFACKNHEYK